MGSCKIAEEMRTSLVLFVVFTTALAGKHYLIETGDTETKIAEGGNGGAGGVGEYDYGGAGGAACTCNCNDYVEDILLPKEWMNGMVWNICEPCICKGQKL